MGKVRERSLINSTLMHVPVMKREVEIGLALKKGDTIVDATFGFGGHGIAIAKKGIKVIGIERDVQIVNTVKSSLKAHNNLDITIVQGNYKDMKTIINKLGIRQVDGVFFDLGVNSWHFDSSKRGFSYKGNEPLDMRFDTESSQTAEMALNSLNKIELTVLLQKYGELENARFIASRIVAYRPFVTTDELTSVLRVQCRLNNKDISRCYQAIRIAVNDELTSFRQGLEAGYQLLTVNGRLVVLSYHSLEDRIIKTFMKQNNMQIVTKKPLLASLDEIKNNPRANSAKLRIGIKK